jgi:hypothetical protein
MYALQRLRDASRGRNDFSRYSSAQLCKCAGIILVAYLSNTPP